MAKKNYESDIKLQVSPKQMTFIDTTNEDVDEVLFGGAAGGGKSYAQVVDALLYAIKYEGSKQLILRNSFPELEKSIIRTMQEVYPNDIYRYNSSSHTFRFVNKSIIDCAYIATDADAFMYKSAEYDVIRFDELTSFTEFQYVYMLSRLRGTNGYPKKIKSSTNPTGTGRVWVKNRFIDIGAWGQVHNVVTAHGLDGHEIISKRLFIQSKVFDNSFLMENDPSYVRRLENLPESERKGLLNGEWDNFDGQYFDSFNRAIHVIKPFKLDEDWRRYRAFDYGLDMLACLWIAVDSMHNCYIYKELCEPNLPISKAAEKIIDMTNDDEDIYITLAPPDMWGRLQESGRTKADIFYENGLDIVKSSNDREAGWLAIRELLELDSNNEPQLYIFDNCTNLIKCIPELQHDPKKPTDCATEPHEITHAPDALRYFAVYWHTPNMPKEEKRVKYRDDYYEDWLYADEETKRLIERKMGGKPLI